MKIIIAPDSFKGSLSSEEAGKIIERAFSAASVDRGIAEPEFIRFAMADGGEGTCDSLGAGKVSARGICGPDGEPIDSFYGLLSGDGGEKSAVIEMAACAALTQTRLRDPLRTTTFGVGELILRAIDSGIRDIILTLGGSATNDGGCGMAAALGVKFFDEASGSFIPAGGTLEKIARIDLSDCEKRTEGCRFTAMCDVKNPLFGPNGAAFVFAPQKGADENAVRLLDRGLRHFADIVLRDTGEDISSIQGAGAAGGMGGGVAAFLHGELKSGAGVILDAKGFDSKLQGASLVISGEGRFDSQSGGGKVISEIAGRCAKAEVSPGQRVPLLIFAGSCEDGVKDGVKDGASSTSAICIQRGAVSLEDAMKNAGKYLYETAYNTAKLIFFHI